MAVLDTHAVDDADLPRAATSVQTDLSAPAREPAAAARRRFGAVPPLVAFSFAWLAGMLLVAGLADVLAPYAYAQLDLKARLAPPAFFGGTSAHWLGTDELGRDVLSRLLHSVRISLLVAFASTALSATIGVTLGLVAAHFRGWTEQAVLTLVDFQASMPFMIVALAVLAFFGNLLVLFVVLMGFHGWERSARIARGLAIAATEQGYAAAVTDLGASPWRVYGVHVLPNIASTLIVSVTLTFPEVILLESGLSFLGLGISPPTPDWGLMIHDGLSSIRSEPWLILAPALCIATLVVGINFATDGVSDALGLEAARGVAGH